MIKAGRKVLALLLVQRGQRPDWVRLIIIANSVLLPIIVALFLLRGRPLLP